MEKEPCAQSGTCAAVLKVDQLNTDLSHGGRHELVGLELDEHIGAQRLAIEHHIGVVVVTAHGNAHVAAHEHEAAPQLQHELLDLRDKRALQVALERCCIVGQIQKLQHIGVADGVFGLLVDHALIGERQDVGEPPW